MNILTPLEQKINDVFYYNRGLKLVEGDLLHNNSLNQNINVKNSNNTEFSAYQVVNLFHKKAYEILNSNGWKVWNEKSDSKMYYSINEFEKKRKFDIDELKKLFGDYTIEIYDNVDDVNVVKTNYILVKSLFTKIENDIFNPYYSLELIQYQNLYYRNIFKQSHHLNKGNRKRSTTHEKSFIYKLINDIFENEEYVNYFMNWLSCYFDKFTRSRRLLVLFGEKDTTDIIIKDIIRPIFAENKNDFLMITNENINKLSDNDIKNKIFYCIDELCVEYYQKERTKNIIRKILFHKNEINDFRGQIIITNSFENPIEILKYTLVNYDILKVSNMNYKLSLKKHSYGFLKERISQNSLSNFADELHSYQHSGLFEELGSPSSENSALENMENGVLITKRVSSEIEKFIKAVAEKDCEYFKLLADIKEEVSYKELIDNFNENTIYQPLLNEYFNIIYGDLIFNDNSYFIKILQKKEAILGYEIFTIKPTDDSKKNGKKRYFIPRRTHRAWYE